MKGQHLKSREPRRKVLIRARMRTASTWGDVCLLNLSSRGAMAQSAVPPPRGTYIEVRRGSLMMMARVVWTEERRFGFVTQDPIAVDEIISESVGSARSQHPCKIEKTDRRATVRQNDCARHHELSRIMARSMEFSFVTMAGGVLAYLAFDLASAALSAPMSQVGSALSAGPDNAQEGSSS